ncbi:MAG: transcription elongation factor GreA [Ignavibacteriales bacterium]|nr:transcription elongation factor GreA [Ignavibacteriales bacterium]
MKDENNGVVYLTREKFLELEKQLDHSKRVLRPELAQKVGIARSHGDLSENAEYDAAKEEQQMFEDRIVQLEQTLSRARIIDSKDLPNDKVYILSRVKMKNKKNGKEVEYTLVSQEESDFEKNKISVTSPIGKALLGKKKGDMIKVAVPAGTMEYTILSISR